MYSVHDPPFCGKLDKRDGKIAKSLFFIVVRLRLGVI